jgi:phosphoribosyl-AMP cyclohydrolase
MTVKIEDTEEFKPRFDESGLITCVTICAQTKSVLMVAYMNQQALDKTFETGEAHYWSRSRGELWHKGATSGDIQKLVEIRTDCDQDCLLMRVEVDGGACHTGRKTCFYRQVTFKDGAYSLIFEDID